MSRSVRAATVAALLALSVALAGCGGDDDPGARAGTGPSASDVDVDTPQLRRMKKEAGVEPCRPGDADDGPLPALTLACLGGGADVDLSTLEGPLVLNFWAASCGPCRQEMPALQEFHERHGERVPVLGVDYLDTLPVAALELVQETGATYPLLADPGGELAATDLRVIGLPTFVFVREDGEVTRVGGGIDSVDEMVDLVEEHLGIAL